MAQILVVDDAALTRETMARLLSYEGYTTATAANGRDAYAMMYQGRPELIILDLMMPQMDGVTFLRLLRSNAHWKDVPVLVMTGFADQEKLVAKARALGVIDVMCKNAADIDRLLKVIRQAVPLAAQNSAAPKTSRLAQRNRQFANAH